MRAFCKAHEGYTPPSRHAPSCKPETVVVSSVAGEGFEPSKLYAADLQSAPIGRSGNLPGARRLHESNFENVHAYTSQVIAKTPAQEERYGVINGMTAYFMWGLMPLYWPYLKPASAIEILAHRIIWSLVFVVILVQLGRHWPTTKQVLRNKNLALLVSAASVLVVANWGIYIWAVNANHVVETSLGYFINPLVSVVLGIVFFGERLRTAQKVAVAVATFAVLLLTFDYGRLPWIALGLAGTFGAYGALKKKIDMPAVPGLLVESVLVTPFALGYLIWLYTNRSGSLLDSPSIMSLALFSGILTALPLIFFGAAAIRVPLVWMGVMQYIAPTIQFTIGITVFNEELSTTKVIGFLIVWLALVIFTTDAWKANQARQNVK
jgi:chloramphenicol-sensitive protein RarD